MFDRNPTSARSVRKFWVRAITSTQFSRARKATPMAINAVLAVIPVAEFDAACDWYASFFGRPADQRPMDSLADWHLIDAGIVQVFHDPGKAGRTTVNFLVDDLDERVARLTATDIATTNPLVVASGRQRLVTCTDPGGNQLGLLETI